ncbi:MAG: tyrosine-type recombinase/integrase [Chelatococcus sp.]|uniref:tyrosine-type recombinase/integrase n=1 Tax=Chelatococcus sp. TaxID=1953771 RepID=UPI0025C5462A|nr:site-specific integrase [Chelatococcus sp.]MBX3537666.1 tyrosine-type recombinase/integrase [Chelatococcus sp.]
MAKAFTVKGVEAIKSDVVRREIPDGALPGLYLVVQPSGATSWAVRYRYGGKPKKLTIGTYPAIELAAARELARVALRAVAEGRDPGAEKKAAQRAAERAAGAERDLVENIADAFVERYAKANTRESTWKETKRLLEADVVPVWRGRRIQEINKRDVIELLDRVVDRGAPVMANRVLAAIRRMFSWCVERGILDTSPCTDVKAPASERSRDRVLTDEEIRLVWRACDAVGWPFGPLTKLLLLTGQRRDEVAEMRRSELDLEKGVWIIPRERVKNDRAHEVPLAKSAIALIEGLPKVKSKEGYVFTTTGDTPVGGFSRAKSRIDDAIIKSLEKVAAANGTDPSEVKPLDRWTLHDLRRTMASGMARLGVNLPVIEKVLNHTSGSFAGVVGIYNRHSFNEEKRHALDAWAAFVDRLNSELGSNVRALRMSK